MMDRQVAHMVRLIDDLLDVSRVSRGKIELQERAGRPGDGASAWPSRRALPLIESRPPRAVG